MHLLAAMRGIALAAIMFAAAPVIADDRPWTVGVTKDKQAEAQHHLDRGNALLLEKKYVEALVAYRAALEAWDHPGIRFSIAKCLIQLDRQVEALEHLEQALAYGSAPFDPAVYSEALSYQKLLAGQIAEIEITCDQPGARLSLDGKHLATCPASQIRKVTPGQHMIVGTRDGYMINSIEVNAFGGNRARAVVKLVPLSQAAIVVHRWREWVPWAVVGGGVVVAGVGGIVRWQATSLMDTYARNVAASCKVMVCPLEFDGETKNAALRSNVVAVSLISLGAAVVATGGVMLYMNRGRTIYPKSKERPTVTVAAMPGEGWVTLQGAF